MSGRKSRKHGHAQIPKEIVQRVLQSVIRDRTVAILETAKQYSGNTIQLASQPELRDHPVNPVGRFARIFNEKNLSIGDYLIRSPEAGNNEG